MIDIEIRKKAFEDLVVLENIDLGITEGSSSSYLAQVAVENLLY